MAKYHNRKTRLGEMVFDSGRERDRYLVLKDAERKGIIEQLNVHVRFELIPAVKEKVKIQLKTKEKEVERTLQFPISYIADFQYVKNGELIVEDVKIDPKVIPKEFALKEKLMFWRYRIKIRRVYKPTEEV